MTDFQSIYQDIGMTPDEIFHIESVRTAIDSSKTEAVNSVNNAVAAIKNEMKFGSIFS